MSRSYKRHPGFVDRNPGMKKVANDKVRHMRDLPDGSRYKRNGLTYSIHDFKSMFFTRKDLIHCLDRCKIGKKWLCFKVLLERAKRNPVFRKGVVK